MKRVKLLMCIAVLLLTVFAFMACAETNPEYKKKWFTEAGCDGPTVGNKDTLIDTKAAGFIDKWEKDANGFWKLKPEPVADSSGTGGSSAGGGGAAELPDP